MIRTGVRAAFLFSILILLATTVTPVRAQEPETEELDTEEAKEEAEFDAFLDALTAREAAEMTPAEVAEEGTVPGVQDGGAEIHVVAEGTPPTVVRGDTSKQEPDDPRDTPQPDDPRDAPPPTIYGEEICSTTAVRGQFEPAQGTWQDDPTFTDKPGKQIFRLSPVLFRAELPMVTGRASLLHGIERAVGGAEPRRDEIFIKGLTTGTTPVPVRFRFTLKQTGGQRIVYESEVLKDKIPLGEPCDVHQKFEAKIDAENGLPPFGDPKYPEIIFQDGEYLLEAELIAFEDLPTGIKVGVLGQSVSTHAPSLAFRLVTLLSSPLEDVLRPELEEAVRQLAVASGLGIPDYYPVINQPLKTATFPTRDRRDLLQVLTGNRSLADVTEALGTELVSIFLEEATREELIRELQVGGLMSGFDRIVVATSDVDFRLFDMGSLNLKPDAVAFAPSQKLVFVNLEKSGDSFTVAHEVAHTLPYAWAGDSLELKSECGLSYHGVQAGVAHGHSVFGDGTPFRFRHENYPHIMGAYRKDAAQWIEQCTYWHVLKVLSGGVPDPPVLLVQGYVGRHEGRTAGALMPFYDLMGVEDLAAGGEGSWAIVLQDARGNVLARHAWEPQWRLPDMELERTLVAFAFRLLRPEGLARVTLEGPDGPLDERSLSPNPPEVTIVSPAKGARTPVEEGGVRVEWSGRDADGDSLLYTVLYSSDGGETWMDVTVETAETSVLVPLDAEAPREGHRVLVRATDGGRSSDDVRVLELAAKGE